MYEKIQETASWLKERMTTSPKTAIILGTGLGQLASEITDSYEFPYSEIPNFPVSTVEGHAGKLIFGKLGGKDIMAMEGRFHFYEGYNMQKVTMPIRVFSALGIKNLIVTNACGGVRDDLNPGQIVIISDHLSFMMPSPLRGPNLDDFGPRFKDMTDVYTSTLRSLALESAKKVNVDVKEGVYCFFKGPQFETPAEIRAFKTLGADMVGMSTVPEAIVARHSDMKILGLSLVTNKAAGLSNNELNHIEVMEAANSAEERLVKLVKQILEDM